VKYTFDLFGYTFRGWGAVLVAMSFGGGFGKLAAMVTNALITALVLAVVVKILPEKGGEEGEEGNGEGNGEDDNGEDDNGGDDAGFMDPNGDGDDLVLWDIQRTPAPALRGVGTPRPTTKAPPSSRDSDQTDLLSVGFAGVLGGPGVQRATKRTGATGRAGSLTRAG
jgi:hypothetical protein